MQSLGKARRQALLALGLVAGTITSAMAAPGNLCSLPPCDSPRFAVTGRIWPGRLEEPHVCLWKDDALAAVSITIDDNTAPNHAWWLEQGERYGIRVTWFVITSLVNDERPGYHGSWEAFRKLHGAGHDVQSHTITHVSPNRGFDPDDPARNLDAEYGRSREIIEREIPGQRVLTLAFPGGSYQRDHTDPVRAASYYVAARGGAGLINAANTVDYRQTRSIGNGLEIEDPANARNQLVNLVDPEKSFRPFQYRGWYVTHFHRVNEADKPRLGKAFAFLQERSSDFWTGLFREVALYGQERDTVKLTVTKASGRELRFTLGDAMPDELFDYPLTVKVRVGAGWSELRATQAGKPVAMKLVEHQGSRYALVEAVPDRGEVVLSPSNAGSD